MATLTLHSIDGAAVGDIEVKDSLVASEVNLHAIRQCVNAYLANRRQGTAMTKTKGMISGGGIKPWRQKGTGRARAGSSRSPVWRSGGTVFGPQPRSYRKKVNKKVRRQALCSIVTDKVASDRFTVLDNLVVEDGRLKTLTAILDRLSITGKTLIVTESVSPMVLRSSRNLQGVQTQVADSMSVYEILNHDNLLVTQGALRKMEEIWG